VRSATVKRDTKETKVEVSINLDGTGVCSSNSQIPFLDHMMDVSCFQLLVNCVCLAYGAHSSASDLSFIESRNYFVDFLVSVMQILLLCSNWLRTGFSM
jgi:hypothetical protein